MTEHCVEGWGFCVSENTADFTQHLGQRPACVLKHNENCIRCSLQMLLELPCAGPVHAMSCNTHGQQCTRHVPMCVHAHTHTHSSTCSKIYTQSASTTDVQTFVGFYVVSIAAHPHTCNHMTQYWNSRCSQAVQHH